MTKQIYGAESKATSSQKFNINSKWDFDIELSTGDEKLTLRL